MIRPRTLALSAVGLILAAASLNAEDASDLSRDRDFTLGSSLAAVVNASGISKDDVRMIHDRPALIQELRWRPQRQTGASVQTDPVREVVFSFYNDALFMIVVDYDRQRTEGLTNPDLIESVASTYGPPVLTSTILQTSPHPAEPDGDAVLARWADSEHSLTLLRGTYPASLRLVAVQKPLESQARTATAEALRNDRQEAPQREADRQKKAVDDSRVALEKARSLNRPLFKP